VARERGRRERLQRQLRLSDRSLEIATCSRGRCELVDLRETALAARNWDFDCRLRVADCCECGGDTRPGRLLGIAVDSVSAYQDIVCDGNPPCPECAPLYPNGVFVSCGSSGVCEVDDSRLP